MKTERYHARRPNGFVHCYDDRFGYPIRICDWLIEEQAIIPTSDPLTCLRCSRIETGEITPSKGKKEDTRD